MNTPSLLITISWCVFLCYWLISAFGAKKTTSGVFRGLLVRVLLVAIVLVVFRERSFTAFGEHHFVGSSSPTVSALGVILCVMGVAFAIWGRWNIGKNWGMPMSVKENPELVTSGPYSYVRHPIYAGVLSAMLGSALVVGNWWIGFVVIFGLYFIYSSRSEEKLMAQTFPGQYPQYKQRTKTMIPFVW
ncbi:MAG TPA: isoprenylcysteine carboxylmethyltransferase family protein [Gemmatimonadaceae bacterium]